MFVLRIKPSIFSTNCLLTVILLIATGSPRAADVIAELFTTKNETFAKSKLINFQSSPDAAQLPSGAPSVTIMSDDGERVTFRSSNMLVQQNISRFPYNCDVDFDDVNAISLLPDYGINTFVMNPFGWIQSCGEKAAQVTTVNETHFHLFFENNTCELNPYPGDIKNDGSCDEWDESIYSQEPRYAATMDNNDVLELKAYNENSEYIPFDLKRIRIMGEDSARVCYKTADQEAEGPWLTTESSESFSPGLWACWNNLSPGYWDLSQWAGNVIAVRVLSPIGVPRVIVDDIKIAVPY